MDDVVELNRYLIETIKQKVISTLCDNYGSCSLQLMPTAILVINEEYRSISVDGRGETSYESSYRFTIRGLEGRRLNVEKMVSNLDNFDVNLMWAYNIAVTDKYDM